MHKHDGFTLVELIVVILLVSILSVFVAPKLNLLGFRESGFVQQAKSMIRLGQKLAITTGCNVDVFIDSNNCTLTWNASSSCAGTAINNPSTGSSNFCADSTANGSPSANFTFDNIGAPTAAVPQINFGDGKTVDVVANTGFVNE